MNTHWTHRLAQTRLLALLVGTATALGTACTGAPRIDVHGPERTSAALRQFDSCDDLATELRTHLKDEYAATVRQRSGDDWLAVDAGAEAGGTPPSNDVGGGRQEGVDFSGTNNQEAGVDEADIVKTDGYHIYTLTRGTLEILGVPTFGALNHASTTPIEGHPMQMLLSDNRLIVMSQVYAHQLPENDPLRPLTVEEGAEGQYDRHPYLTKFTVLDITDRTAPSVLRQVYLEGFAQTGRKVNNTVRMVSHARFDVPGIRTWLDLPQEYWQLEHDDPARDPIFDQAADALIAQNDAIIDATPLSRMIPRLYERTSTGVYPHAMTTQSCQNFAAPDDGTGRGFTSIFTLDLTGNVFAFEADHVLTNQPTVYASSDTLVIAEPSQNWWWFWGRNDQDEATNIHRFDISQPGETTYTGSGRVDGLVLDQFALSEHNDDIRVAATTGTWNRWWLPEEDVEPQENHVYVLRGDTALTQVGHVGGIAPNERIWSARFVGDKGYLVTFRQVDPLFTIDLSVPENPRVIGELKIEGVSTYIHPLAEDRLLTIGYGGDENGLDWTTQISMFDVSDFSRPTLESELGLAPASTQDTWNWSYSEALHEHKAFQYWGPQTTLAVPLSTWRETRTGDDYSYEYISKLALVTAEPGVPLAPYGEVDHSALYNHDPHRWYGGVNIRRSIFMGNYVYAISERGVTATNLDSLEQTAQVSINVPD